MEEMRNEEGKTLTEFLNDYDPAAYPSPSATSDICVMTMKMVREAYVPAVLLIKRLNHPYIGQWALPGGFVEMNETFAQAAQRELFEETGVNRAVLHPVCTVDEVNRDPRTRIITGVFFAAVPHHSLTIRAGDDAKDARLFTILTCRSMLEKPTIIKRRDIIELYGKSELLRAQIKCVVQTVPGGWRAQPEQIDGGGMASDHALILWRVMEYMRTLPRPKLISALIGTPCTRRQYLSAAHALGELLGK